MTGNGRFLYCFVILFFLFAVGCASGSKNGTRVLVYSDHEPLGNMRTVFLNDVLFPAIEEESGGRLKIEAHWNGEKAISYNALPAIALEDKADMAVIVPEYFASKMPLHQLFKSFPTGPAGKDQILFFQNVYKNIPVFSEELKNNNIHPVFFATGYPVAFFSRKPLKNLEGMKKQRWRTASFWHRDFLKNTGAEPVAIPWGKQVFDALEKNELDGLMVNVDSGYDLNVHTIAPHILISENLWLGHLYIIAINRKTWDALPDGDKAAFARAADKACARLGSVMGQSLDTLTDTLKKDGASVRRLSRDEVLKWAEKTDYKTVQQKWAAEKGDTALKTLRDVSKLMP